jgi:hypothetical protein
MIATRPGGSGNSGGAGTSPADTRPPGKTAPTAFSRHPSGRTCAGMIAVLPATILLAVARLASAEWQLRLAAQPKIAIQLPAGSRTWTFRQWAHAYADRYAYLYRLAGRYLPLMHWHVDVYRAAVSLRRDAFGGAR